jgi:hypothetical protein
VSHQPCWFVIKFLTRHISSKTIDYRTCFSNMVQHRIITSITSLKVKMEPGSIDFPPCSLHWPGGLCQSFQVQRCCFLRRFKYTVHQLSWVMWYTVLINPWFEVLIFPK